MDQRAITTTIVGILALQGDYAAHRRVLEDRLGTPSRFVRSVRDLDSVDALILPGGESTTIAKLLDRAELVGPIQDRAAAGMPVYGTCAGMILMACDVQDRPDQPTLQLMDITVARNAFGRQVDSFEAKLTLNVAGSFEEVRGVFIRAPFVSRVGDSVRVVASFDDKVVGVRQGALLATAFHPELTDSDRVHKYFLSMVAESREDA